MPHPLSEVIDDVYRLETPDFEAKYYTSGIAVPRYHVPATRDNAEKATNYLVLHLCPFSPPCDLCLGKFADSIDCDYLEDQP